MEDKEREPEFYYTTHTPHQWSTGPANHYWVPGFGRKIESLEEAKELAMGAQQGRSGEEGYVETGYGVHYKLEGRDVG